MDLPPWVRYSVGAPKSKQGAHLRGKSNPVAMRSVASRRHGGEAGGNEGSVAGEIVGRSVATRRRGGDASGSQGSVPEESVGGSVTCRADGSRSLGVEEGAPSSSSAAAAGMLSPLSVRGVDEEDRATEMMSLRERRSSEDRPGQVVSGSVRRVRLPGIDTSSDEKVMRQTSEIVRK